VSTPWFSRYFLTAERYEDAVRGASARPVVNDGRRTVMHASGHVIVEYWNRSVRFCHSRGMCFIHGSVPRAFATENQRRSAVEAKRFLDLTRNNNDKICLLSDTGGATWHLPWSRSALAEANINVP
jgi:hypothetical protein